MNDPRKDRRVFAKSKAEKASDLLAGLIAAALLSSTALAFVGIGFAMGRWL